jgi:hypothetical protein
MKMNELKITKSNFIFYCFAFLGLIIAFSSSFLMPGKYFSDALIIINNSYDLRGITGSYPFTIFFYEITGLKYFPFPIVAIIQYPILIFLLLKIYNPNKFNVINIRNLLMYFSFFILGIYISMPSKEFLTFLFCFLLVIIIKKRTHIIRNRIIICLLLIVFSIIFRSYFIIVLFLSILFSFLHQIRITNNLYSIHLKGILFVIFISLSYGVVKGSYISNTYKTELNKERLKGSKIKEESRTAIIPPVSTDTWYGESLSILHGFIVVNFPLKSIFSFSPQVVIFSLWQIVLFIYLFIKFNKKLKTPNISNINWAFYITFAFFLVQGLFEPDLGSSIKHKAGIFPLIYFILFYESDEFKVRKD